MELKASCRFDYATVKALTYVTMYKRSSPKKQMLIMSGALFGLIAVTVLFALAFGNSPSLTMAAVLAAAALILNAFMWFIYPKITYNALAKMKGTENTYVFTDEKLYVTSAGSDYSASAEVEYTLLVKVYETSEYLFLYQTKNQVFPIDKSTVENGTLEQIRGKLLPYLERKYVICKY